MAESGCRREEFASGNFVEPTVFGKVSADMRLAQNEVFGPVLAVIPFETEDEVVAAANSTIFGLAATIWTNDIKRAHTMARRIKSGNVSINYPTVNPPEAPFGGFKQSGIGRELEPLRTRPLHPGQERRRQPQSRAVRLVRPMADGSEEVEQSSSRQPVGSPDSKTFARPTRNPDTRLPAACRVLDAAWHPLR